LGGGGGEDTKKPELNRKKLIYQKHTSIPIHLKKGRGGKKKGPKKRRMGRKMLEARRRRE